MMRWLEHSDSLRARIMVSIIIVASLSVFVIGWIMRPAPVVPAVPALPPDIEQMQEKMNILESRVDALLLSDQMAIKVSEDLSERLAKVEGRKRQ